MKSKFAEEIWVHGIELEFPDCQFLEPGILKENIAALKPLSGYYIKTFRTRDLYDAAVCTQQDLKANHILFYALVRRWHVPKYGCAFIVGYSFSKCKEKLQMMCALKGIELV